MKTTLSAALIIAFLIPIACLNAQPAKSQIANIVYILPDGSVIPVDAPILRKGDTYELTGDLVFSNALMDYGMVIQRDNIVVDGAGFLMQKALDPTSQIYGIGINMTGRSNVTITNLLISQFGRGLKAANCSNIKIENAHITHGFHGMEFINSSNIEITGNTITSPGPAFRAIAERQALGIYILGEHSTYGGKSSNFTISRNTITNEDHGIWAYDTEYNVISWNNISECQTGIGLGFYCQVFANNLFDMVKFEGSKAGVVAHHGTAISPNDENQVYANNFTGNGVGIKLNGASGNVFYGNNFVGNQLHDVDLDWDNSLPNTWDNGTYGNYWSNYKYAFPNATEVDDTGTGNFVYGLSPNNTDNHPLLKPISVEQAMAITPPKATPQTTEQPGQPLTTWIVTITTIAAVIIVVGVIAHLVKKRKVK